METLKMQACVLAVLEAAKVNNWQHVLDMGTDNIEEMLEESDVETVEQAVHKFKDLEECICDEVDAMAEKNKNFTEFFLSDHCMREICGVAECKANEAKIVELLKSRITDASTRVHGSTQALSEYAAATHEIQVEIAKLVSPEDETGDVYRETVEYIACRFMSALHFAFGIAYSAAAEELSKYVLESDHDAIVEAAERAAGWSSSM